MTKYYLEITAFIVGFCIMALEIVGSRVLAPYFGTSVIVWTSIIGIVLGALSAGYYYGGKVADKNPNVFKLSLFLFLASIYIFFIAIFKEAILISIHVIFSDIRVGSSVATMILLTPAAFLMAAASPYLVRLKLKDVKSGGSVAGRLYAISTVGSIIGTFAIGFYFFEWFGNTKILLIISVFLLITVFIIGAGNYLKKTALVILLLIISTVYFSNKQSGGFFLNRVIDIDTKYNRVWITERSDQKSGKNIRVMNLDPFFIQSAMFIDSDELVFDYTKIFAYDSRLKKDIKEGLILGGAAYSYPKEFLRKFPDAHLDVVEIDPGLTILAKRYFRLKDSSNLNIYHEDARVFINNHKSSYDVIYIDVFSSASSIPFHLTTKEAVAKIKGLLNTNGIVFVNIISSQEGESSLFFKSIAKTYKSEFDNLYYILTDEEDKNRLQNYILIAFNDPNNIDMSSLENIKHEFVSNNGILLTDDFAPVENMLLSAVMNSKKKN